MNDNVRVEFGNAAIRQGRTDTSYNLMTPPFTITTFYFNRTVDMPVRGVVAPDWNREIIYSCSVDVENRMLGLYRYVEGCGHKGW
jgi:hypothetical protein